MTDKRKDVVAALLDGRARSPYVSSESLAREILEALDQRALETKWEQPREKLLEDASNCWIPHQDLVAELNKLPGLPITDGDISALVIENKKTWRERIGVPEYKEGDPDDQADCLRVYKREKRAGTAFMAILTLINEEVVSPSRHRYWQEKHEEIKREHAKALDKRLRSGVDFYPTCFDKTQSKYGRLDGALYRLIGTKKNRYGNLRAPYEIFSVKKIGDTGVPAEPHVFPKWIDFRTAWSGHHIKPGKRGRQ